MNTIDELAEQYSFEELAAALYRKGKRAGYHKVTDKTKWREPVMAEKLGHRAFEKISAGKDSDKYGADAINESTGVMSEYKTKAIEDSELRNLLQLPKNSKGARFAPLTVSGVYNGAYSHDIIDTYADKDHCFGIFYEEQCVMIIRPQTEEVLRQLHEEIDRRERTKKTGSTNLNTVSIRLDQTDLYDVVYKKQEFFDQWK
jgi:hypothetical protein